MESKKLFVVQKPREVENAQARVALKKGENSSKHQLDYRHLRRVLIKSPHQGGECPMMTLTGAVFVDSSV